MINENLSKPEFIKKFKDSLKPHNDKPGPGNPRDFTWSNDDVVSKIDILDVAKKYGFSYIGGGKQSTVFTHPNKKYVIKLFGPDGGYLRFLKFCLDNRGNKYLPKIRGKVIKINNNVFAVRLEKLTPYDHKAYATQFFNMCIDPEMYLDGELNDEMTIIKPPEQNKEAANVAKFLVKNRNLKDFQHYGNIMMRGREPVLIDPLYNYFRNNDYTIDPWEYKNMEGLF
jgi:hypothetical protein